MKKILAVVMAIVMMMAIAVPAFAADTAVKIEKDSAAQKGDVVVSTTTEGTSAEWYTVTIPADTQIVWGTTIAVNLDYTVACQLATGKTLSVAIASANTNSLVNGSESIAYNATGFDKQDFAAVTGTGNASANVGVAPTTSVTITVPTWEGKTIADYADTLTYTVTINEATGA